MRHRPSILVCLVIALVCHWSAASGFANAELGSVIENVTLPTIDGGQEPLLADATVNVFIFFKPGQEHSESTIQRIGELQQETVGKSVHWVAIVSDRIPPAEVRKAGLAMPVLVDQGDELYGRLSVVLEPAAGITDREHRLVAYQPYTKVNYLAVLRARIRHLLKEITDAELAEVLSPQPAHNSNDTRVAHRRAKLAEKLFAAKLYPKALESIVISVEKDPAVAATHALHGQILAALGQPAQALAAFNRALELDPANETAKRGKQECEKAGP
jgi:tetratricopeptide (TPR) repeat protein